VSWQTTRLKFLASIPIRNGLGESGGEGEPSWPRYIRTTDIAGPRTLRNDVFASLPPKIAAGALLRSGDIVMTAAGATIGKMLLYDSDAPACYAGYLVRFRPRLDVDGRFIAYWMESQPYWDQIETGKVVSTIENFSASKYQNLRLSVPDPITQRAIADYLDQETARIDALIEKKGKLVSLLQSRVETVVENHIRQLVEEYGSTPLKYAVRRVEVGIVITPSVWYGDEGGVPALRGLNVQPGRIDVTDLVYLTEEGHEVHRKSVLRQGDVVVVRTGQAGAAAVVPSELDGCNCIDLVIVRPSPELVPQFLEYVLNSDWTQKHVEEYSVGTIQSHFNVGAMKQLPIPLPPLGRQSQEVEKLGTERAAIEELKECLTRQIDLLTEHRQALITAAVTGELEIPGVAA